VTEGPASVRFADDIDGELRARIVMLLAKLDAPEIRAADVHIRVLAGGTINQNFVVDGGAGSLVLRIVPSAEVCASLSIDCAQSAAAMGAAAAEGLAPAVIARDADEGHVLVRYLDGPSLTHGTLRAEGRIRKAGEVLSRLHRIEVRGIRQRSAFEEIDVFVRVAEEARALSPDWAELARALAPIRHLFGELGGARFCHRDINPQNLLAVDGRLYLIDFDYAGIESPYLDLGVLSEYGQLDDAEQRELLAGYMDEPTEVDDARVRLMRFVHNIRDGIYAAGSAGLVRDRATTRPDWLPGGEADGNAELDFYESYAQVNLDAASGKHASRRFEEDLRTASRS
jgi:tRNA A-37 threonylcarbamoyl transferase component Bud32